MPGQSLVCARPFLTCARPFLAGAGEIGAPSRFYRNPIEQALGAGQYIWQRLNKSVPRTVSLENGLRQSICEEIRREKGAGGSCKQK